MLRCTCARSKGVEAGREEAKDDGLAKLESFSSCPETVNRILPSRSRLLARFSTMNRIFIISLTILWSFCFWTQALHESFNATSGPTSFPLVLLPDETHSFVYSIEPNAEPGVKGDSGKKDKSQDSKAAAYVLFPVSLCLCLSVSPTSSPLVLLPDETHTFVYSIEPNAEPGVGGDTGKKDKGQDPKAAAYVFSFVSCRKEVAQTSPSYCR